MLGRVAGRTRDEGLSSPFRVCFVPGVTPDKWVKIWGRRYPASPLTLSMVEESHQRDVLYDLSLIHI